MRLQTTFGRYEIRQPFGHRVQRHTHRGGGGARCQSVVNIVHARNIDLRGALPHRRDQLHGRGVQAQFVARAIRRVRRRIQAKFMCRNTTRLCALAPDRRVGIISREDHRSAIRHAVNHIGVLVGNGFDGLHEFLVLALGIVDDCHGRRNDRCQLRGLARMIHTQFNHRRTVGFFHFQQGQRQANIIVQIAARGQIGVVKCRTHDCGQHFFHRGFAVAARHHSHWHVKL